MCGVTTRAGVAESTHIWETCPSLCCSCTHFVHTIKGEKVVKILNVGLKGRKRLRLKEITAAYQFDCESMTSSGNDIQHKSSSTSLLQKSLVQRCARICAEVDTENFIDLDDYGMTLTEFKNSLGKAKKKLKILRSGISGNGDSYGPCSIVNPERSVPCKEETTELGEPLSCYILKLKGKKVRAQKCLNKIPDFSSAASGEDFVHDYSMQKQYVSNVIKKEEPDQDVKYSIHSPHTLASFNITSTNTRNVEDTHVSCAIKEEVDLNYVGDCVESYLDSCSSAPCLVDANLSSGSTRDERKEDKCKDQMQEVDFFASENVVYLSCAGLPPKLDEATKTKILQPCLQESSHNSITQACSYFSSLGCDANFTSTDESPKESNILGHSRMINLTPASSEVKHDVTCPADNCSESHLDNYSSIPCPVDANLSSGSTRDKSKEDRCKDQMREVDFFASENVVYLSCAGLPPKLDEATKTKILQPCLQESSHNSITQACSYFSSLGCDANFTSTDESPKESNILGHSRMINLTPASSEVKHDVTCPADNCSESHLDNYSSIPCPVDANLSSGSTRDKSKEDRCKDQMREVDFFASENVVHLSYAGLPPEVDEATKKNILQPCLQDIAHNSISQACSYFSSLDCKTSTYERPEESNILGYSRMINLAPVCSEEVTFLEAEETFPLLQCSFPNLSVTDQWVISTEYKSTSCLGSSQQDLLCEAKASLDSVRNKQSTFVESCYGRSEQDEASPDPDKESKSSSYNIPNDDSSPQKSTLPSSSCRFSNASSSMKEVSEHTSVQVAYPAECFTSNAIPNCKRKVLSNNDEKTMAVHDDSISPGENIQVVEVNVADPDFQSQSTSPAISSSLDNASSYIGEFSEATVGQTVCPVERLTSDVVLNQKRKASPNYIDDWKLRKHPRILLTSRKVISPTPQKRLQQAMDAQELSGTHLSRLNLKDAQLPLNAFDIECKSGKSPDGSSPSSLMGKSSFKNLAHSFASTETDAQKAIRFSQRQMHDIESLAAKLLKKLKCMKNIVEETLRYAASPSTPLKYTDEEIRGAAESASELEDGARRLLAMMARDCNRFCKIMNSTSKKGGNVSVAPKDKKKIMFADEAGRELCHVKVFEDVHNQTDSDAH